ncbi:MAG: tRNA-specific 2-thiouridylase [Clostridiaceae bacterium]|jgi:tRNA-specific 2-thiouridylase|nr:tRNA-specific 2-thiouridylase [Clostridiaceae bacterium]
MLKDSIKGKQKVLLALSGGVDSVASAILLKRMHDVETVTFLLKGDTEQQKEQTAIASEIAKKLGLSHHVLDLTQRFREYVLQPFLEAWRSGKTPNPCVMCNPHVKFKALMALASKLNCQGIATGHYARVGEGSDNGGVALDDKLVRNDIKVYADCARRGYRNSSCKTCRDDDATRAVDRARGERPVFLYRAADPVRDQSYFMYRLTPDVLRCVLFPVGGLSKDEVRSIVTEEGLSVATEKDSQDLCFLDGQSLRTYLRERIGREEPGPFLDLEGHVIGEHDGIWQFTVGQRRHLGASFGRRMTVLALEPERNAVILGDEPDALMEALILKDCFFPYDMPQHFDATVKLRSQGIPLAAHVEKKCDTEVLVRFNAPVRLSSPGQSAVFYENDRVLGGGVVSRLLRLKSKP